MINPLVSNFLLNLNALNMTNEKDKLMYGTWHILQEEFKLLNKFVTSYSCVREYLYLIYLALTLLYGM